MYEFVKGKGWIELADNMAFSKDGLLVRLENRKPEIGERWIYKIEGIERAKRSMAYFDFGQRRIYGVDASPDPTQDTYTIILV